MKATNAILNLPRDASRIPIQAAEGFTTVDVSVTPKTSPLTVSNSILIIAIPTNVYKVMLLATGSNDVRLSEKSDASQYIVLVHAQPPVYLDVAGMDNLYVIRDASSDATLNFAFFYL